MGLTSASTTAAAADGSTELHFRTLQPNAVFVTDRSARVQDVVTQTTTRIDVAQNHAQVEQLIDYVVRYEPLTEIVLDVPAELADEVENLEVLLLPATAAADPKLEEQGTPLHVNPNEVNSTESAGEPRPIHYMLPQPWLGRFAVRIHYRYPKPSVGTADTEWPVPLIRPVEGRLASHNASVRAQRGFVVSLDSTAEDTSWKQAASAVDTDSPGSALTLSTDADEMYLPLAIRAGQSETGATTTVDRVWLQTWFANEVEQNRAAFRFRTANNQTTVELPPDILSGELEILVDRKPAEVISRLRGELLFACFNLTGKVEDQSPSETVHTLELRSRQPYRNRLLTRHRLTPPQIDGSTALSQIYWQIVLPADRHVVGGPAQMNSASQWQWLRGFFGRQPIKLQSELEEWTNATEQPGPTDAQNVYLYTGLLPVSSIELTTSPRWLIVLAASAIVLAISTLLMYLPTGRRNWVLAVLACAIAAGAIAYPTPALLVAQAAAIGLVLSVVAVLLSRFVARRFEFLSHRLFHKVRSAWQPRAAIRG